jgi:ABC-type nitrate/sulfonate/bicarbonate transport system permease component
MRKVVSLAKSAWLVVLLLVGWEAMSRFHLLDPLFFPPPSTLFSTLGSLTLSGVAGHQVMRTLERTALGFGLGVVCGAAASTILALWATLRQASQPLISALYAAPRLTLLPMVMLLVGVNDFARILLVALGTTLLMTIQISDAVRAVNKDYVDLAVNYGASRTMVIRKVYLPACLPQIFTALRLSFSRALVLTISVELLNSSDGLGSMIWNSWQTFAIENLYVSIGLAAALGLLSQALFDGIEKRLVGWKDPAV